MVFWLNGATEALGPEKFGFCTTLSPRAVMVSSAEPDVALAPPANTSVPVTVIPVWLTTTAVPLRAVPVAVAVSVTVAALEVGGDAGGPAAGGDAAGHQRGHPVVAPGLRPGCCRSWRRCR